MDLSGSRSISLALLPRPCCRAPWKWGGQLSACTLETGSLVLPAHTHLLHLILAKRPRSNTHTHLLTTQNLLFFFYFFFFFKLFILYWSPA